MSAAINQKWRKTGNPGVPLTADDLATIWLRDGGRCKYCGIGVDLMSVSFDHVIPFDDDGVNEVVNVAASCITCQRQKHTKSPEELREYRALDRRCKSCGRQFMPRFADYVRGLGWYCSRKCSGKAAH